MRIRLMHIRFIQDRVDKSLIFIIQNIAISNMYCIQKLRIHRMAALYN